MTNELAVHLQFEIGDAYSMGLRFGKDSWNNDHAWLRFRIKAEGKRQYILLSTGEDLSSLEGTLHFKMRPNENLQSEYVGHLIYAPAFEYEGKINRSCYDLDICLSTSDWCHVRDLFINGKIPENITISTSDLKFGATGGNEKIWNVEEKAYANILSVSLGFSLKAHTIDEEVYPLSLADIAFEQKRIAAITDPFYKDAAIQVLAGRNGEREKADHLNYTDKQVRMAIVHAREDIILIAAYISGLHKQLDKAEGKLLLTLILILVVLIAQFFHH